MTDDIIEGFETSERWRDNPLALHIRPFAIQLIDDGYAKNTVQSKLWSLTDFGKWLRRRRLTVANIDEALISRFFKDRPSEKTGRGDVKTLAQFLDDLRRRQIVPQPKPIIDKSALGEIV